MKKIFLKTLGWLTVPGIMHVCNTEEPLNPASSTSDRQRIWVAFGLSVIAMLIYGYSAIYFGKPAFHNTGKGVLSPLFALVWLPNLVTVIISSISVIVFKKARA